VDLLATLFGDDTHKAEVLVSCFGRLADSESLPKLLCILPHAAQVEVCSRLGWSNVFRMPFVSMHYVLSLTKEDDKRLLKKLFHLNSAAMDARNCTKYIDGSDEAPISRLLVRGSLVQGPMPHREMFDHVVRFHFSVILLWPSDT